jgi:hypothetical protein
MRQSMIALAAATAAALNGAGCSMAYLSAREAAGRSQPDYLYSLYDKSAAATADKGPARPLRLPTAVAVVQVGEVAPPQRMIDALRKEPAVFSRVEALPGNDVLGTYAPNPVQPDGRIVQQPARPSLSSIRAAAADAGMEYVLLVGGTIEHDTNSTPLSLLNLTIVGAFVVPSVDTHGLAKGSAALIDVRSGRVVTSSSAEARDSSLVPSVQASGEETKLMDRLRDDVAAKLGAQVLADAKNRAAFGPSAATQIPIAAPSDVPVPAGKPYRTAELGPS